MAFPKVQNCIVCEDVRQEVGRKQTLLGFFGVLPNVSILVPDFDKPIPRLCLLFITDPADGKFHIESEIVDESGKRVIHLPAAEIAMRARKVSKRVNLGLTVQFPQFSGPGLHELRLIADGEIVYRSSFEVGKGSPQDFE